GKPLGMFDRILLDAPCSGLGVLRRNPDTKWSMSKNKLRYQSERQIKFLDILAPLVKPSGILVYAVCSTEPEENDAVVNVFLNKHPLFVIINNPMEISNKVRSLVNAKGYLRTLPHVHNMDGFFSVCFKRIK
ncbi:16S rRNA (cytosine(967)-C(5))-methyltransferase RsmB, partial [Desulfobacteraceae bacterium SEEP-SAG9]